MHRGCRAEHVGPASGICVSANLRNPKQRPGVTGRDDTAVGARGKPTAVDLFAGAGGLSLAALMAGIDVIAAVERDPHACRTYRRNLIVSGRTDTRLFEEDMLALDPAELMARCGIGAGECDMLLGGPPCQGFSAHRIGDAGTRDPRNQLLNTYFAFVRALRPMLFFVENVPGMLWPRHRKYVDGFYVMAENAGYGLLAPTVLNAKDFGVPQNRKRVFLVGYDRRRLADLCWPPQATHREPGSVRPGEPWRDAGDVFAPAPPDDENDVHMRHGPVLTGTFLRTPVNGGSRADSGRELPCHERHQGHRDVYGRINPAVPGPTMTTACINPSKGRFAHPVLPHGITLRQAARYQTFPDWFVFEGGLMAGGVQIGNAVPVDMGAKLLAPLARAAMAVKGATGACLAA